MYGMVNQAIKEMVVDEIGLDLWNKVCDKLGTSRDDFTKFEQYDDKVTLNLVVKVCELTGKDAPEILENFGKFWIEYAYRSEYSAILATFSKNPLLLIKSLNSLHERVEMNFDKLDAPSFDLIEETSNKILINYYSDRDMPLEFFVKGLFSGIFDHFGWKSKVEIVEKIDTSKATFKISYEEVK